MKAATEEFITQAISFDKSISVDVAKAALALLRGEKSAAAVVPAECAVQRDVLLSRAEVAKKLRVSKVTVSQWARKGIIRRMTVPGRKKAVGYSQNDVFRIINGSNAAAVAGDVKAVDNGQAEE